MATFAEDPENEYVKERHPLSKMIFDKYCTITGKRCEMGFNLVLVVFS